MLPNHRNAVSGEASDAGFLREIEALSKALSLDSQLRQPRSLSVGRSRLSNPTPESSLSTSHKRPKKPSLWKWKPLKALSQLRPHHQHHRLDLLFSLYINSISSLPTALSDAVFLVHFDDAQTLPVKPFDGAVVFEETLAHRRPIHATCTGPHLPAKYEACQFVVSVSIDVDHEINISKHRVDLARLLPVTLEELEGETRSGMWSTSFALVGSAKGASLNVRFGYEVIDYGRDNDKGLEILGLRESRLDKSLRRVGSIPGRASNVSRDRLHLPSVKDFEVLHGEYMDNDGGSELSDWAVDLKPVYNDITPKEDVSMTVEGGEDRECCDELEFVVVEKGIEIARSDRIAELRLENRKLEKAIVEQEHDCVEEDFLSGNIDWQKTSELLCGDSVVTEKLDFSDSEAETSYKRSAVDGELKYRTGSMRSRSYSLDDLTESVASKFLSMLELGEIASRATSDVDIESPREQLWDQFEESLSETENDLFGLDSGVGEEIADNVDLSSLVRDAELEHQKATQAMESKCRARMLEEAEIEALMREWGLNEKAYQSSPPESRSGGFGSPIDLTPEELL